MRNVIIVLCMAAAILICASALHAEVPRLINYQGILTDSDGIPLDGTHDLIFKIYADSTAGADDIWSERHAGVQIDEGLFNIILGTIADIPDTLFADGERWMGISVDSDPEMYPRMQITSVPWALRAVVADSAIATSPGSDGDWQITGDDMHSEVTGKVGVGTTTPLAGLHVEKTDVSLPELALLNEDIIVEDNDAGLGIYSDPGGNYGSVISLGEIDAGVLANKWSMFRTTGAAPKLRFSFGTDASYAVNDAVMTMMSNGCVGIGTKYPTRKLEVSDTNTAYVRVTSESNMGAHLELKNSTAGASVLGRIDFLDSSDDDEASIIYYSNPSLIDPGMYLYLNHSCPMMINRDNGYVGIGNVFPDEMLHVSGTVKAGILKLSSGADIAEPFDVEGAAEILPGMVVAIDPGRAGKLKICEAPYDRCVAGIVSGAGGLEPGMIMGQEGSIACGDHPVALTGRVYCWADASNEPIVPGDLLTSSGMPGHAMKVIDHDRAQGAVIGKAMSSLEEGTGLVLVLVTLQ